MEEYGKRGKLPMFSSLAILRSVTRGARNRANEEIGAIFPHRETKNETFIMHQIEFCFYMIFSSCSLISIADPRPQCRL